MNYLTILNLYSKVSFSFQWAMLWSVLRMQQYIFLDHILGVVPIVYCPHVDLFPHVLLLSKLALIFYFLTLRVLWFKTFILNSHEIYRKVGCPNFFFTSRVYLFWCMFKTIVQTLLACALKAINGNNWIHCKWSCSFIYLNVFFIGYDVKRSLGVALKVILVDPPILTFWSHTKRSPHDVVRSAHPKPFIMSSMCDFFLINPKYYVLIWWNLSINKASRNLHILYGLLSSYYIIQILLNLWALYVDKDYASTFQFQE